MLVNSIKQYGLTESEVSTGKPNPCSNNTEIYVRSKHLNGRNSL